MPGLPRYAYVSTRASIDPVKTVLLFPPSSSARTLGDAERFARSSGWVDVVEDDAAVLMVAVAPSGWDDCPPDLPMRLYQENRRSFSAPAGQAIRGTGGSLWAWETLIYLVGYEDGATFAGDFLLSCPGFSAASVLVGGCPRRLEALDEPSCHWLVEAPRDYSVRNRDIPVSVWLMGEGETSALLEHALTVDAATSLREVEMGGCPTQVFENPRNAGMQVRVTPSMRRDNPALAPAAMDFFSRVIRWKNGPDGTLAPRHTREEFLAGGEYRHDEVEFGGDRYHYAVYLPRGTDPLQARGLPLVLSVHGRGEPTWIFSRKNGWEDLADETGEFAVLLPDSPGNVWSFERDSGALAAMVESALGSYGFDPERVYVTGFSNGAVFSCQVASSMPQLFAAASPWNGPSLEAIRSSGLGTFVVSPDFAASGFDMPFWICSGDSDDKAGAMDASDVEAILAANSCASEGAEHWDGGRYPRERGYEEGDRFDTTVYPDAAGVPRVGVTVMRNMPHGAIADESRAAWEFMRRFRRPAGARRVEVM